MTMEYNITSITIFDFVRCNKINIAIFLSQITYYLY